MTFEINWEGNTVVFFTNVKFADVLKAAKEIENKTGKEVNIERGEKKMSMGDFVGKYVEVSIAGEETISATILDFTIDGMTLQDKQDDNDSRRITDIYYIPMRSINSIRHNVDGEY